MVRKRGGGNNTYRGKYYIHGNNLLRPGLMHGLFWTAATVLSSNLAESVLVPQ